jgi:hypothetical protein
MKCISCLSNEYIYELKHSRERRSSVYSRSYSMNADERLRTNEINPPPPPSGKTRTRNSITFLDTGEEAQFHLPSTSSVSSRKAINPRRTSFEAYSTYNRICCCLFTNQKNDFHSNGHRRSVISFSFDNNRVNTAAKKSRKIDFFKDLNKKKLAECEDETSALAFKKQTLVMFDDEEALKEHEMNGDLASQEQENDLSKEIRFKNTDLDTKKNGDES